MKAKRIITIILSALGAIAAVAGLIHLYWHTLEKVVHKAVERFQERQAIYDSLVVDEIPDYSGATPHLH